MEYIIIYLIIVAVIGYIADGTTLGFWGGFFIALFLTPLVGFIVVLFYPSKEHRDHQISIQQQILDEQRRANSGGKTSAADELAKWKAQHDAGIINADEYAAIRAKLLQEFQ